MSRRKLPISGTVVNEPTLRRPTVRQMSATVRSVLRKSAAALEPAREQVLVRAFAEGAAELSAEVCRREAGGTGKIRHAERVAITAVREVLRPEQVPSRRNGPHLL